MKLPPAYVRLDVGESRLFVRQEAADWARRALSARGTLQAWASDRPTARTLEGRGRVWDVPAPVAGPDGRDRWAVRHYRRGGAVAPLLDDRYLALETPRPVQELRASEAVRARGIPTPAVMAGAVYPVGLFYRADLVTELIPGGVDLRALLFSPGEGPDVERAMEATGRLVRRMESAGIYHRDLNAANVLLTENGAVEAHLLDLDRCQVREAGTPAPVGPMRDRLRRSLRKLQGQADTPLGPEVWKALKRGLGEEA